MNFKAGQKVVCVIDGMSWGNGVPTRLVKDNIYTIRLIDSDGDLEMVGLVGNFSAKRFRALPEPKGVTMTFEKLQTVQPIYQS